MEYSRIILNPQIQFQCPAVLEQGVVVMATVLPESKLQYGVM